MCGALIFTPHVHTLLCIAVQGCGLCTSELDVLSASTSTHAEDHLLASDWHLHDDLALLAFIFTLHLALFKTHFEAFG